MTNNEERDALAWLILDSEWWAVKASRVADAILAAGYRRQPEPREVTTVEEFALVGNIYGKHISVSRADAEKIAAKGGPAVHRIVSDWSPATPGTEETP